MPKSAGIPGRSSWFDLPVTDLADAMSFYEGLLGWRYRQMDSSAALTDYVMIESEGELIGGLRKVPKTSASTDQAPVLYFTVPQLDEKIARAKELGARLEGAPVDLGGNRGRYQWIRDREGTRIGLWSAS
jgi:predicted enzyme related to lactoylglutathione lyase